MAVSSRLSSSLLSQLIISIFPVVKHHLLPSNSLPKNSLIFLKKRYNLNHSDDWEI